MADAAAKAATIFSAIDKVTRPVRRMGNSVAGFSRRAQASFARAETRVRSLNNRIGGLMRSSSGLEKAFAGAFAAMGGAAVVNSINKMSKLSSQVRTLFNVGNQEGQKFADQLQVIAAQHEVQAQEVLQATNAVTKQMNVGYQKAFKVINQGFKRGGDVQGEFLSQLKEYPAQLNDVGLSAKQAISIITQSQRQGVFNDKGVDSLKEAGSALKEMPTPTREAVNKLFESGDAAAKLQKRLNTGETTLFEEIQRISGALKNTDKQAEGMVLADVFKGPGEDALSFIKALDGMNTSMDAVDKKMDPFRKQYLAMQKQFVEIGNTLKRALVPALLDTFKFLKPIGNWMQENKGTTQTIIQVIMGLAVAFVVLKGTLFVIQGALSVASGAMWVLRSAAYAGTAAQYAWSAATGVATAATWAFNAALAVLTSPITLIIALIGALIAVVVSLANHWDRIVKAFTENGIVAGIKAIGVALLDAVLMPVQMLLKQVAKLPDWLGGGLASNAEKRIEGLRRSIGALNEEVEKTAEKSKAEATNPKKQQQDMQRRLLSEQKMSLQGLLNVNINDPDNRTSADLNGEPVGDVIQLTENNAAFTQS